MKEFKSSQKICAVDFDGTLCYSQWPGLGKPNMALIKKLQAWKKDGNKLILWTCRAGQPLEDAVEWCREFGLEFDAINDNLPEIKKHYGNNSRKVSADIYIDDKSILPKEFARCNKYREGLVEAFSFLFQKTRKNKEKKNMERSIKKLGVAEYLFQLFTTPNDWEWEYEFNKRNGIVERMYLIDENDNVIALYEDFTLAIRGDFGVAKFNCEASIKKTQLFILDWLLRYESRPEFGWSRKFELLEFKKNTVQREVREDAFLLPHGWEWHTRIEDGHSWLESPKGKVVCEYDFENETFRYEKEWRTIRHEDEADFRKFIEKKTRQKMYKSRLLG